MDSSKVDCILSWPTPQSLKALRGFLDLRRYYRRFVQDYSVISKPLIELLKKEAFKRTDQATQAFQALKTAMITAPVVKLPDFSKAFEIETNACGVGVGAVLMQDGHSIAFLRKSLCDRNKGLSIYEKELLALVMAVTKWKHYLLSHHFVIRTDHQSLKYLLEQRLTSTLQHRWLTKLLGLDYKI
ncbi:hypothetical protein ACH5RR_037210 [Cinchona calisaya]|uniref:Reverse transcriptase RNase H-like domain-containing protein n=1 Tax=Cinchona calisaya TaxID=153742 RepID=A0ABD2Y5G5_9GENT